MESNHKPIGDYIQLVKEKNKDALITNLLGINIDNFFMPSIRIL
jgi:type I restriction enzyme S subunit